MEDDRRSSEERSRRVAMDKEGHMNKSLTNCVHKLTVVAMDKAFGIGGEKLRGMDKRLNRDVEKMSFSTEVVREEVKQEVKVEAVAEAGDTRKGIDAAADEEKTEEETDRHEERREETCRYDSYEDISTVVGQSKQDDSVKEADVMTRPHQPLLLHRAPRYLEFLKTLSLFNINSLQSEQAYPVSRLLFTSLYHRLGLSHLQKPSGIHDITIIKGISFNEDSQSDGEVSFIKEE